MRVLEERPQARVGTHKSLIVPYAVAIMVWALDFKAATSGGAAVFQGLLLLVYSALLFSTTAAAIRQGASFESLWVLLLATGVFMIDSAVVGLNLSQPPYAILVNLIPPLIYVSASLLSYITLAASKDELPSFLNALRLACLVFAALRILSVYLSPGGLDVASSRWGVISGAVVPSLGIIAVALLQRLSYVDVLVLTFNLLVTLLSVTRTLFVALAAQIASVFLARPGALFRSYTIKGLALFAAALMAVVALDVAAGTGLVGRWVERLTVSGSRYGDPTALTRSAETNFMLESFAASTESVLFGNGLAAVTSLTGPDAERAAKIVGWSSVDIHSIGYGHESYASILFVAGLFGGGGLLIMQFVNGLQSVALLRRIQPARRSGADAAATHIGAWGAFIVIGMLATGFLSGNLGDRSTCIWYGIGTGMLYWAREVLKAD